jgi:hypothetical protein
MKSDLIDAITFEMKRKVEMVAAQGVMANRMMRRVIERAIVARLLVVIKNDFLIK